MLHIRFAPQIALNHSQCGTLIEVLLEALLPVQCSACTPCVVWDKTSDAASGPLLTQWVHPCLPKPGMKWGSHSIRHVPCASCSKRFFFLHSCCPTSLLPLPAYNQIVGQKSGSLQFCVAACESPTTAIVIDPIALAAVVILTLVMVFGVKESFWFNVGTVAISLVAILLCIFMGAPKVNNLNFTQPNGFLPFGFGGVVKAASSVFFA